MSSKGTIVGCYTLHTTCVGLIKSLTHPYLDISSEDRHHREGAVAIMLHLGYKHI